MINIYMSISRLIQMAI